MNCLEFRRRVGAEPFASDPEIEAHRRDCAACARHQDELRAMDGLIQRALAIEPPAAAGAVPADGALPAGDGASPAGTERRKFLAIAASLVAGIAVGLILLVLAPRASIAREVVSHMRHEPGTMDLAVPLAAAQVAEVLDPDGMRLKPGIGDVTFAARCVFDGRVVPHLVVQRPEGPVTVFVLRHRSLGKPMHFDQQGYSGVVLPAPRGAIAVVGREIAGLDAIARRVFDAVDWAAEAR